MVQSNHALRGQTIQRSVHINVRIFSILVDTSVTVHYPQSLKFLIIVSHVLKTFTQYSILRSVPTSIDELREGIAVARAVFMPGTVSAVALCVVRHHGCCVEAVMVT